MHESSYTAEINKKLRSRLRRVWKIKADAQNGVEDCYYLGDTDLWIEYKLITVLPKKPSTYVAPDTSLLQEGWLQDHWDTRQNSMVIIGVKNVPGMRGCGSIPFYSPDEWLVGLPMAQCVERMLDYDGVRELIMQRCHYRNAPI